ncbi:AraC family transcriptional regulator, regulatory protein of adaptative response / methylphosphotriester-DNA alkyltransferase methyltransferase [Paenibacillus uliginis N3/975]|uniref:AraC family transcriptional regulator, regulatory protein of adaptative response / methylphosphotriester-DNA alkyltransferase methyltransferase n=2 Tax=Paenibacillus TaxID=44249 RepID=A0A1X7HCW9_9BACL|nr:AraC family transcriptional regulator, regulatory protein of adaptative response / methylphosphotriester-DNA alkyltransferase methyltransferase [Paenibacillus uliginis N3/975]
MNKERIKDSMDQELPEDPEGEYLSDEQWSAIINNDSSYDDQFFYAVRTTGIFCRPSCKSKAPMKSNVRIFQNAEQALSAHFRPCKRCKPTGERLPDREWVEQIEMYIDNNYAETITLEHLADICHGSPYHLQRTFKRVTGITPVEYVQQKRIEQAKQNLIYTDQSVSEISLNVGMANVPYFITLFKKKTGYTPKEYRYQHQIHHSTEVQKL